ncbi:DUF4023 domain-containing protein [Paenibacillus filicis]|uniref:DUF4023 domain-containing protein n=1 Tax=Paenibacillus filicis TaxID=669464 RepID=A0ABU9DI84_9BACL
MKDNLKGSTEQFVDKLHDTQAKDDKNRAHNGGGHPESKLPGEQHRKGN